MTDKELISAIREYCQVAMKHNSQLIENSDNYAIKMRSDALCRAYNQIISIIDERGK